ncbi:MAG: SDR family NAD(P)-dependent oxidoreductase [Gammaproteobacteria bacterium]|nr:SDR family NAD(P)-dependent oxidoreductase [Gammaproteobacteria bacterium]MCZ6853218.1 SDR family NAD(P)-dependent oxidoreductase [Gammaproteobacteria bacterium]
MGSLENKHIIITGAGSGIGRATSILAAEEGANIVAVDIADSVHETAVLINDNGGNALAVQADVSDEKAVASFVQRCVDEHGSINGIYANAGVSGGPRSLTELTVEDWQQTLAVNTIGVFLAIKHAVPHLIEQGGGAIVCTASVAGLRANAGGVAYSASKAGVISIVQTVAYQLYNTGVRINAICPGLIETGMTRPTFDRARERGTDGRIGQVNPTRRAGQPREIAEMACFLLSDRASYVNGQAIPVDGGLSSSHPWIFPR